MGMLFTAAGMGLLAFALFFWLRQQTEAVDQAGPGKPLHQSRQPQDLSSGPAPPSPESPEEIGGHMMVVDCRSRVLPSPERAPTQVDAVFIDLIRQAAELPSALLELSQLLRDPDVQIRQVVSLVGTDPVLSARFLRVANSAAVGRGKITSLQKAVVLLGFSQVWLLVNQMLTSRSMMPIARLDEAEMRSLWRHAAASSTCARHLMTHLNHLQDPKAPTVLTCALLHDVGKFFLRGIHRGRDGNGEGGKEEREEILPVEIENRRHAIDHCRLGYLLTTYWKLPEEICTSIAYHHHLAFANHGDVPGHVREVVTLVMLSDYLANVCGYSDGADLTYRLPESVFEVIGFKGSWRNLVTPALMKELKRTALLIDHASDAA